MLSFIIPAHNEQAVLSATLAAIHTAARSVGRVAGDYEIIVVNDASTDATADLARAGGAQVVEVNLRHIAAVRNAGAGRARGEVLVFVDADTLLPGETLRAALRALDEGCVAGGALVRFDHPVRWTLRPATWMWDAVSRFGRLAAGCFIFTRREAFFAVGGFDETYYVSEEIHLSNALKKQGRFVILSRRVVTSGRKLRMYGPWRLLGMTLNLLWRGPKAWRKREGLWMWYDGQRESSQP